MEEKQQIEQAIRALEAQRTLLGDAVVDAAISPMREKLASLEAQEMPEQQRKQVTLLFMDIAGHTQLIRDLDPEENMEIIDQALVRLSQPVQEYGGHIARYQGDGFKAVFGLPAAHEDDPERAVRAGLAIQAAAQDIAAHLETERGMPGFKVRVGIDTGLVVAGGMTEGEDTVKGIPVNLAARLESAAQPGSLLISHNTYRHIRGVFDVSPLEPLLVKGFAQPVQTYQVLRAKPRAFRMATRGVEGVETRMIGRQAELQQLQDIFNVALQEGETQSVTIVGEPGIGKSRLLYEFEQWVELQPEHIRIYRGRATPGSSGIPFGLLRSLFAFRFNILESDLADIVRQKLETGLGEFLSSEPLLKSHFIGAMLGYDFKDSPYLAGVLNDPKQLYAQAIFYLGQYLTAQAQQNLVLIFLEDIHWADNASLDAMLQLTREHLHLRLMVVCLARPAFYDNRPHWGQGETSHTRLDLQPLSRRSCRELVSEILQKVSSLPDELREQIVTNAEGNPFYVEELVKILIEDGVILKDEAEDVWRTDPQQLPDLRIPATLTAVLQARLDGLPEAERTALQQAAVVGRIFWDAVIQVLQEADQPPQPALSGLIRRELVYPREASAFAGTDEYIIKHALLRDVVYESVLKRARRVYHRKTADWLVEATQSSGRGDEYAVVIGKHYEQAGENLAAAEWYIRAGEKAKSQGAYQEASQLLPKALELLPATAKDLRWRALLGLSSVLSILGKTESWRQNQATLMELAQESQDDHWLSEAFHREGYLLETIGNLNAAIQAYKASVNASQRSGDSLKMADTLGLMSIAQIRLGERPGAMTRVEEALEIIQGREEEITTGRILTNISVTLNAAGDKMRALLLQKQAVAICQRFHNQFGEAVGLSNIGYDYTMLGQPDLACSFLETSDEISETIGSDYQKAFNSLNLALAYWRNGGASQARALLEKAIVQLGEMEEEFGRAAGHSYLGLVLESEEKYVQAEEQFRIGKEKFQSIQILGCVYDALAGQARCALRRGQLPEAFQQAAQLWDYLTEHGSKGMEFPVWAYLTCAQVFEAAGDEERCKLALQAGYNDLIGQAEKISEMDWQVSFLNNIPEHQEIASWWQKVQTR